MSIVKTTHCDAPIEDRALLKIGLSCAAKYKFSFQYLKGIQNIVGIIWLVASEIAVVG